jgi:cytochrome P450
VTRHEDIEKVSRNPSTFSSAQGVSFADIPTELLRRTQGFLAMDPPEHTRVRRSVQSVFTPRQIARIQGIMDAKARAIVDDLIDQGPCDFVAHVSSPLPMWISAEMLGVPLSERDNLIDAVSTSTRTGRSIHPDAEDASDVTGKLASAAMMDAIEEIEAVGRDLLSFRRKQPGDDLISKLAEAEVDGVRLKDDEVIASFVVLIMAANDTTRNTTSSAMHALTRFPEQRELLIDGFDVMAKTAIEEFVRWATPIFSVRRTVVADTKFQDVEMRAGDKVAILFVSGNRDERVFDDPFSFDLRRDPNRHISFGGGGPHHCIGANLARGALRSIFGELLRRVPHLNAGEPEYMTSNSLNMITRMSCEF